MRKVAKSAGITRQTIYNHYSDINHAVTEGENDIITAFPEEITKQSKQLSGVIPNHNYRLFYATMSFMAHRRDIFTLICNGSGNNDILCRIAKHIYPRLEIVWLPKGSPAPDIDTQQVRMLLRVTEEILCEWSTETDCDVRKADQYIRRLLQAVDDAARNQLP